MIKEKHIKPIPDRLLKRLEKIDSESLEDNEKKIYS